MLNFIDDIEKTFIIMLVCYLWLLELIIPLWLQGPNGYSLGLSKIMSIVGSQRWFLIQRINKIIIAIIHYLLLLLLLLCWCDWLPIVTHVISIDIFLIVVIECVLDSLSFQFLFLKNLSLLWNERLIISGLTLIYMIKSRLDLFEYLKFLRQNLISVSILFGLW